MDQKTIPVHVEYEGDDQRQTLVFDNGDSESLLLEQTGPDTFRLEESSLLGEIDARYHDEIRASLRADGSLQFQEIVSRSGLYTQRWILSESIIESAELQAVLDSVVAVRGNWERAFGGLLLIHVPPEFAEQIDKAVKELAPPPPDSTSSL